MSVDEAASKHGFTPKYVRSIANVLHKHPSERVLRALAMLQGGADTGAVASALNITPEAVRSARRRARAAGMAFPEAA